MAGWNRSGILKDDEFFGAFDGIFDGDVGFRTLENTGNRLPFEEIGGDGGEQGFNRGEEGEGHGRLNHLADDFEGKLREYGRGQTRDLRPKTREKETARHRLEAEILQAACHTRSSGTLHSSLHDDKAKGPARNFD